MTSLGLYLPGDSALHRARAGHKLLLLVVAGAGSIFVDEVWQVLVALGAVSLGYGAAGIPLRTALAQLRPLVWVAGAGAVFHVIVNGWERAVVVLGFAFLGREGISLGRVAEMSDASAPAQEVRT